MRKSIRIYILYTCNEKSDVMTDTLTHDGVGFIIKSSSLQASAKSSVVDAIVCNSALWLLSRLLVPLPNAFTEVWLREQRRETA